MRKTIVANWKSNKTIAEAIDWLKQFSSGYVQNENLTNIKVIACPPFTLLSDMQAYIKDHQLPILLGAQDISPFAEGAYTGAVSARQIKEVADCVIVGHSERRKYFEESPEVITHKMEEALKNELTPILCISTVEQVNVYPNEIQKDKAFVAYEPLFAIGSGKPDTPENAQKMAENIKKKFKNISVLYGGSVTSENVKSFTDMSNVDGVLVGGASLDASSFLEIVKNAY